MVCGTVPLWTRHQAHDTEVPDPRRDRFRIGVAQYLLASAQQSQPTLCLSERDANTLAARGVQTAALRFGAQSRAGANQGPRLNQTMGVPQLFRYLSEKYPRMMVECVEQLLMEGDGSEPRPPSDISPANPNAIEFDNLYLDMNGIIHPCTHPEDAPAPTTEAEMFAAVFDYIDRIMAIVRPRKVLYMAIDGVAPRAKINQQRSRRFRSAKEADEKAKTAEALKRDWAKQGLKVAKSADSESFKQIPKDVASDDVDDVPFDSNVITPGTPFMERLAIALKEFAALRVAATPGWKDLRIVFSDASAPGEGEHKIAEYIRVERATEGYDANIRHVLYGLDADLIMLALATHEVHFTVLREEVFPKNGGRRQSQGADNGQSSRGPTQIDALMASAEAADGLAKASGGMLTRAELGGKKPFQFLHINILREYLDLEFRYDLEREITAAAQALGVEPGDGAVDYDLERVIDDFVFLLFFVGNDFLPHLPTLDIREGAIDFIIEVYKTDLARVGYLTSGAGDVDFARAKQMLSRIGTKEDEVFQERKVKETQSQQRDADHRRRAAEAKERQKAQKAMNSGVTARLPGPAQASASAGEVTPRSPKPLVGRKKVPVPEVIPPMETLMELGDKNKPTRVGDGSANRQAAAKFKRKLGVLKQQAKKSGKATSIGGSADLPVAEPGIAKRSQGSSPIKSPVHAVAAALEPSDEKKGEKCDNVPAKSDSLEAASSPGTKMEVTSNSKVIPLPNAEADGAEEKSPEEFEKELKARLDAQRVIENPTDTVRLGDEGWKDRYYQQKFNWGVEDREEKERLFHTYLEGLYWVMKYYYVGCISWNWYYPYHYAPFASDIVSCETTSETIHLEMGKPFHPFTQLQAVMPASSGVLVLPTCYSRLMTDPESPIIDYYPEEFEIDLNGKKFVWQGVALLPFIDEDRLNDALDGLDSKLTEAEAKRNSFGDCLVIAHGETPLGQAVNAAGRDNFTNEFDVTGPVADGQLFGKLTPRGSLGPNGLVVAARFELPPAKTHSTALLPGAKPDPPVLDDFMKAECSQRGGWKPARFGSLGRAARELGENRNFRLGGGRGRGRGGRPRGNRGRGRGGGGGGYSNSGQYQSQVPVINPPAHPAAAAMFGGLGGGIPLAQPAWMAQGTSYYGQQQQGGQAQAQAQVQAHAQSGFGGGQQQQFNAYGANTPAYGGQNPYMAQYASQAYGAQAYQGGGAGMYQHNYASQYGGNGTNAYASGNMNAHPPSPYNFSANPGYYAQQWGGAAAPAQGTPTGGGLAGPTAMQMRQASNSQGTPQGLSWGQFSQTGNLRGRGRGSRGGNGRY